MVDAGTHNGLEDRVRFILPTSFRASVRLVPKSTYRTCGTDKSGASVLC